MSNQKLGVIFLLLQIASTVSCFGLFFLLMIDTYEKFANKRTTITIGMKPFNFDRKYPPCITICALDGFKNGGLFYKDSEYLKETFNKEELLQNFLGNSNYTVYNETAFSIEEIQTVFLGRCYTICQKVEMNQLFYYLLFLNKTRDIKGRYKSFNFIGLWPKAKGITWIVFVGFFCLIYALSTTTTIFLNLIILIVSLFLSLAKGQRSRS